VLTVSVFEIYQHEMLEVQVVTTSSALHFFKPSQLVDARGEPIKVWTDDQEWQVCTYS
jgi:hypothetical protein